MDLGEATRHLSFGNFDLISWTMKNCYLFVNMENIEAKRKNPFRFA